MSKHSIDDLKGYLIKVEFNFETKRYDFYVGFPEGWVVDFHINEIIVTADKTVEGAVLYIVSSTDDVVDSELMIKYVLNIIKYNKKIISAREKLEQKLMKEGQNLFKKEIAVEAKPSELKAGEIKIEMEQIGTAKMMPIPGIIQERDEY